MTNYISINNKNALTTKENVAAHKIKVSFTVITAIAIDSIERNILLFSKVSTRKTLEVLKMKL